MSSLKGNREGVVMKLLKKSALLGLVLAGTLSITGFAFDLQKDATEWTADPDYLVTMYLGMPQEEFDNNFSGLKDWDYRRDDYMNANLPCNKRRYTRNELSSISKNIYQEEFINASFSGNSLTISQVNFSTYQKKLTNNYKKDILPAFEQGKKVYQIVMDNMVKKLGKPTNPGTWKRTVHSNGEIHTENIWNSWYIGNDHYTLFLLLTNEKKYMQTPDYCPVSIVGVAHTTR